MLVVGTVTASFNFSAFLMEAFGNVAELPCQLGVTGSAIQSGTAALQAQKLAPFVLTLAASTPQDLDLANLVWPDGTTLVNFTGGDVRGLLLWHGDSTAGHVAKFGPAAANGWTGPFGGTSPTLEIRAGSPVLLCDLIGGHWAVDATHHLLTFDPGATAQTINGIIFGV